MRKILIMIFIFSLGVNIGFILRILINKPVSKHLVLLNEPIGTINTNNLNKASIPSGTDEFLKGAKIVSGNCSDAYGKLIWPETKSQAKYKTFEGYFKNNLPNGYGRLFDPTTNSIYFGQFKNGQKDGFGILQHIGSGGYIGEYKENEIDGKGFTFSAIGDLHISDSTTDHGFSLLSSGKLKRYDIYNLTPTADNNSPTGVFIPQDLDGCFKELNSMLMPEYIEEIRNLPEDDYSYYHFSLGGWMRNNWGLWKESRLKEWFNDQGIFHPDDMSGIILDSYWRYLNDKPILLDKQIKYYQDYWEKMGGWH